MTTPSADFNWVWPLGFAVSAALLWFGASLEASAASRARVLRHGARAAGAVLIACGLWWPGHLMPGDSLWSATPGIEQGLSLAVALAWAAVAASAAWVGIRSRPAASLLWLSSLAISYLQSLIVMPQVFNLLPGDGITSSAVVAILMSTAVAGLHVPLRKRAAMLTLRAASAVLAAAMLTALAATSARALPSEMELLGQAVMMSALLAMATFSWFVISRTSHATDTAWRVAKKSEAYVDALTRLPTRVHFEKQLSAAAKKCVPGTKDGLALLFIDLDGFKPVNDTFGHNCGDRVLEKVGKRLRSLAGGRFTAARVGGDEFLLMLNGVPSAEAACRVATRLIASLSRPYKVEDREISISCSVGIAMYPDDCTPAKLIARADAAMYSAKRAGGSGHCVYSPDLDADAGDQFELLRDLRRALSQNEFELFYQPKMDAKTGLVTAAEALLRWQHPTRGTILPDVFIPIAERFGLIGAIGDWVIEDACRQGRVWRERGLRMRVAINLSAHQMKRDDLVDRIAESLQRHRIHPSLLTCEITESTAMEDTRATQETFRRLGQLGAHLSIDDFGTGYSSLSYLRKLPAEELKIDRSFVLDLEHSADARAVVDAVVKLAHALGLKVVAEGVENMRQRQILTGLGCDELQGFLFARPMSARALLMWAMRDRSESAAFRASLFGETREAQPA